MELNFNLYTLIAVLIVRTARNFGKLSLEVEPTFGD